MVVGKKRRSSKEFTLQLIESIEEWLRHNEFFVLDIYRISLVYGYSFSVSYCIAKAIENYFIGKKYNVVRRRGKIIIMRSIDDIIVEQDPLNNVL